ncbi:MAG: tetratricopeptide repeat protein [Myxococcales bacterium]|nr:tetratricopeptide repeat protein [Myxococcales bacterium]
MKRALTAILLVSLAAPAAAQRGRRGAPQPATTSSPSGPQISRFQDPAQERSIAAADEDDDLAPERRAELPENVEEVLFLRERPDALGAAAREWQSERLDALLRSREELVVTRRDEAIRLLEEFIAQEPETAAEMPDALLRLAELLWEKARVEYLRAFAAWQEVPEANRGPAPVPEYQRPLALYDRILERHRRYDRYDFVLYMKAYALVERGDSEGALRLYVRILQEFPRSRFVPDAHFALAESRFGALDWAGALPEFEQVMQFRESELYDISLFKSAWCLWRMGQTEQAAVRFRQVLDLGRGGQRLSAAQRRRLRELQDEALDYLIQVFIEDENNTARDVFAFLEEIGGERYGRRVLTRLSDTFMGQSRYERAVEAYELLLEMDPTAREAPEWQRQIVSSWGALDDSEKVFESLRTLAANYGPSSTWASQQTDPERVQREWGRIERLVRRQAMRTHEIGQRESQSRKLEEAVQLYGIYLEHFGDAEDAYQIEFFRAEINFHRLNRYPEAGEGYLAAARRNPRGEYTKDALYNAIGAFERVREQQLEACGDRRTPAAPAAARRRGRGAAPTPTAPTAPTAPAAPDAAPSAAPDATADEAAPAEDPCSGETSNDRKFGEAIALYVELFPDDPDLPEILFRQGRLYYDRGVYDPAVRLFGQLLERFPRSEYASPAGELILDSFNRAQDYANIESWARRLKSAPAFSSAESQGRLDTLIIQSMFKVGEQLAERNQHAEAAEAYLRAAEEFPRDARAKQALYNAGLERQRAGDLPGAARAYELLIERHPGTTEGAQGAWAAAQMYESIAQFGDAARFYEAYGRRFPEGEKAHEATYNAVLLRVTAGDHAEAVSVGRYYLERYPRRDEADDVYFFIGRAHEGAERWSDAADTYREYIRRSRNFDRKVEAQTRLAQVLTRMGDTRGADQALEAAVTTARRNRARLRDGLYFAAQARYLQGDRVLADYEAIQIAGPSEGLRQRLQRKSELLQRAALIYADVVEFRVAEWVTASLFQIGRSFEIFAEAMRAFEVPAGLTEEEEQVYLDQLAMFIIPMEERALEAFEGGYQKAIELRIYNRWTARLLEALQRLNSVQYPPLRESGGALVEAPPLPAPRHLDGLRRDAEASPEGSR